MHGTWHCSATDLFGRIFRNSYGSFWNGIDFSFHTIFCTSTIVEIFISELIVSGKYYYTSVLICTAESSASYLQTTTVLTRGLLIVGKMGAWIRWTGNTNSLAVSWGSKSGFHPSDSSPLHKKEKKIVW